MLRRERFFAALLLAALAAAPARAAGDPDALAELLGADDETIVARADTREAEFPGGALLTNDLEPDMLNDIDARTIPPFRFTRRRDADIDDPYAEVPSGGSLRLFAKERRRENAERDRREAEEAAAPSLPAASVREVRPDRFPFRSVLDPPDPIDGLRRK